MESYTEHLIVGAGLAGLYSGYRLETAAADYQLIEARDRPGGRVETTAEELDLGPSWFWPHQMRVQALLSALSLDWFDQYSDGDALFQQSPGQEAIRSAGAGSMLSHRIQGGSGALINSLVATLAKEKLQFSQRLRGASRQDDIWSVDISTPSGPRTIRCRHLILALPPRQIAAALTDSRSLPEALLKSLQAQQTWMSGQAKFLARYARPFWRSAGLSGDAFSRVGPLAEVHDASASDGKPAALFGFVGVPAQARLDIDEPQLVNACVHQLTALFGPEAAEPEQVLLRDWSREPLTATVADQQEMPAHANFPMADFRETLESMNLWLSGSEFDLREPGYLEGALGAADASLSQILP